MATSGMSGKKENTQLMAAVLPHITQISKSACLRPYDDSLVPQVTTMMLKPAPIVHPMQLAMAAILRAATAHMPKNSAIPTA